MITSDSLYCPMCGSTTFQSFRGREKEQCVSCGSLGRTRAVWLILQNLGILSNQSTVLHFAPEPPLALRLAQICGPNYIPTDIDPDRYAYVSQRINKEITRLDLCQDLVNISDSRFDLVIHNHVLEHIPCSVTETLKQIYRILIPNGLHIFTVPMKGQKTEEDLSDIPVEERIRRFKQADHLRLFGADLIDLLTQLFPDSGPVVFPLRDYFSEETLVRHSIPLTQKVFVIRKAAPARSLFD